MPRYIVHAREIAEYDIEVIANSMEEALAIVGDKEFEIEGDKNTELRRLNWWESDQLSSSLVVTSISIVKDGK